MKQIDKYIANLAKHSARINRDFFKNPRNEILVNAGISLNWLGDFFANPKIRWEEKILPIDRIEFSGTNPKWNKILIDECAKSVNNFKTLIKNNAEIKKIFQSTSDSSEELILVRKTDQKGKYRVLDGMHRFINLVLKNTVHVKVYVPVNDNECLPICEAHTVYDLIRGFERHAHDDNGKKELYYALKLLTRTYTNVRQLLQERFNKEYIYDKDTREIIEKVLANQ